MIALVWFISSVCYVCLIRPLLNKKSLLHWLHWCGLSPVCFLVCLIRLLINKKAFLHLLHCYGFSPLCVIVCIRSCFLKKTLLHCLHWHVFSPMCNLVSLPSSIFHELALLLAYWAYCIVYIQCMILNLHLTQYSIVTHQHHGNP